MKYLKLFESITKEDIEDIFNLEIKDDFPDSEIIFSTCCRKYYLDV